jgi:U3 small nucleolar ribonucleoprotein protein IMP3
MVRKLKHHEQKLLKKVDFAKWGEGEMRENLVTRKYFLQDRNDYKKYPLDSPLGIILYVEKLGN